MSHQARKANQVTALCWRLAQLGLAGAFLLLYLSLLPCSSFAQNILEGMVVNVRDGDTIKIKARDGTLVRVRLSGIDAPETPRYSWGRVMEKPGQPFGKEASDYLKNLVYRKQVRLETYGLDPYHRVIAFIFVNDTNVNLEMVKAGLAEVYRGHGAFGNYKDQLLNAEKQARSAKQGMWIQGKDYERPMDFRKRMRRRGKD